MGGDALFGYDGVFYTLFLLTPPRGGDVPVSHVAVTIAISTCAPAWGATYPFPQFGHCAANFYSRPRVGGDPEFDSIVVELREFLLTPPYGGDTIL